MPTTTVLDLIGASMRRIGLYTPGESIPADEAQDALDTLVLLLETWSLQRRLVYHRIEAVKTLTGVPSYTIGPGGDIPMLQRPLAIREAFVRVGAIDYPVGVIYAEQYANIGYKGLRVSWPYAVYYDPAYPLGVLTFWPVPSAGGELHLGLDMQFDTLSALSDSLSFPPGYRNALIYALGKALAAEYGKALSQEYVDEWRRCEYALAKVNHRPVIAQTDPRLPGAGVTDPNWIQHGGFR